VPSFGGAHAAASNGGAASRLPPPALCLGARSPPPGAPQPRPAAAPSAGGSSYVAALDGSAVSQLPPLWRLRPLTTAPPTPQPPTVAPRPSCRPLPSASAPDRLQAATPRPSTGAPQPRPAAWPSVGVASHAATLDDSTTSRLPPPALPREHPLPAVSSAPYGANALPPPRHRQRPVRHPRPPSTAPPTLGPPTAAQPRARRPVGPPPPRRPLARALPLRRCRRQRRAHVRRLPAGAWLVRFRRAAVTGDLGTGARWVRRLPAGPLLARSARSPGLPGCRRRCVRVRVRLLRLGRRGTAWQGTRAEIILLNAVD
jgi:hypothetical protein